MLVSEDVPYAQRIIENMVPLDLDGFAAFGADSSNY